MTLNKITFPQSGSAQKAVPWAEPCLMLHNLGLSASEGMEDSLYYPLLLYSDSSNKRHFKQYLTEKNKSLPAFFPGILMD